MSDCSRGSGLRRGCSEVRLLAANPSSAVLGLVPYNNMSMADCPTSKASDTAAGGLVAKRLGYCDLY